MTSGPILLVGEVVIDVVGLGSNGSSVRFGGICHACRALAAVGVEFEVAYAAPSYAWDELEAFLGRLGAASSFRVAETLGSPGVMIVGHAEEATYQAYDLLLRDQVLFRMSQDGIDKIALSEYADALVIAGNFPLAAVLGALGKTSARVHIDWANAVGPPEEAASLGRATSTFILSTSSAHFLETCEGRFSHLLSSIVPSLAESVLLKENRGGARFQSASSSTVTVGAQIRPIKHSIGIGDCFDAVFIASAQSEDTTTALRRAAWCAAEYAATFDMDVFVTEVRRSFTLSPDDLALSTGIVLPWEARAGISVYIAAPDFSGRSTENIDAVEDALNYHNFRPRRPVQEVGQLSEGASEAERSRVCDADLAILETSAAVVGVYDDDDPGTLVELGFAAGKGIPAILYDPDYRARNPMLTGVCHRVTHNLDELILGIFRILGARGA